MSDDRQKLKALLLSEEIAQIKAIHKLLNDKQQLTERVSEVLDPAAELVIARNPDFQKKFTKVDPQSYVDAVKANKQTFIDALLPIIGPMIRKSVSSAIRRFVADVNRAVEMGISAKALKWRWKSFQTGVPFAEIVFNNTIEYQVQQVFLIDNNAGILIEFAGHEEDLLQDKEAMSAMLTAIQDFVKDAVSKDGEGLSAAELGDDLVWVIHGNKANIAAVIKGAPTSRLRDTMSAVLEDIHLNLYHQLEDQSKWNDCPDLKTELEKLLLTKTQSDDVDTPKGINFWPWIIALLVLITWFAWSEYEYQKSRTNITNQLTKTPGFVLNNLSYEGGQFIATGLQDPLTIFNTLDERVVINSTPFLSLQDDIVARRVATILEQPNIQIDAANNNVTLTGTVNASQELQQKLNIIRMMPGVNQLSDQTTPLIVETLEDFLRLTPPPHNLQVTGDDQGVQITGVTTQDELDLFTEKVKKFGPVDSNHVAVHSIAELTQLIQSNPLKIINTSAINTEQKSQLDLLTTAFLKLNVLQNNVRIKLTAQSDCQGSVIQSNENNQMRLEMVYDYLQSKGLEEQKMLAEAKNCTTSATEIDLNKIGVWFEVLP